MYSHRQAELLLNPVRSEKSNHECPVCTAVDGSYYFENYQFTVLWCGGVLPHNIVSQLNFLKFIHPQV